MKLLVGLGNPGQRYADTRHNAGFAVVTELARRLSVSFSERLKGEVAVASLGAARLALVKPQTFMNASGECVRACADFYKVLTSEILVVHDELDLDFGVLRLKVGGGEAGHNGLKSIKSHLGSSDFARLRVGIGRPPVESRIPIADYVLSPFTTEERASLPPLIDTAARTCEAVVLQGAEVVMRTLHQKTN